MTDLLKLSLTGVGELGEITRTDIASSSITNHSPTDSTPSVATVTVSGKTTPTSHFLAGTTISVDEFNGLSGYDATIDTVSSNESTTTVSGPSAMSRFLTGNINIPAVSSGTPASAMDMLMQLTGEQRASNSYSGGTSDNMVVYTMNGHGAGFGPNGELKQFPDETVWAKITRAGTDIVYPQSTSYAPPSFGGGMTSGLTGKIYANNPELAISMKQPLNDPTQKSILSFIFPKDSEPNADFGFPTAGATLGYVEGDIQAAYFRFDYEASNNRFAMSYTSTANPGENVTVYLSTASLTGDEWLVALSFNITSYVMTVNASISDTDGTHKITNSISPGVDPDVPVLLWSALPSMRMVRTDTIPVAWTGWDTPYEIPTTADIQVSNSLADVPIAGMNGTAWDYLNQVCSGTNTEVTLINNVVTLRGIGTNTLTVAELVNQTPTLSPVNNKAEKVSLEWSEFVPNPSVDVGFGGTNKATNPSFETPGSSSVLVTNIVTNPGAEVNTTGYLTINSTLTRETSEKYQGTASFKVVTTGGGSGEGFYSAPSSSSGWSTGDPSTGAAMFKGTAGVEILLTVATTGSPGGLSSVTFTATGDWQRVQTPVLIRPSTASSGPYVLFRTVNAVATTFYVDLFTIAKSYYPVEPFDGSTVGADYTYAWTGATNNSTSTASAFDVVTLTDSNVDVVSTTGWSDTGASSALLKANSTSNNSFAYLMGINGVASGMFTPGETYTVLATLRLTGAQTDSPLSFGRSIYYAATVGTNSYEQAPNAAGVYHLSHTFTVDPSETNGHIRLYNGASAGNGDVWWDSVVIIEGTYTGDYFDGSTPQSSIGRYAWNGTANASTSNWVKRAPGAYSFYEVENLYSVDTGQTTEILINTPNYLSGLMQPRPEKVVDMLPPSTLTGYAISGSDNLPVDPTEWLDFGGRLTVSTTDLYGQIKLTLTGPTEEIPGVPGPYSFSASDGATDYPLIRIAFIGVTLSEPIVTTSNTGAAPAPNTQIEPVSFTNVCATTLGKAWSLVAKGAKNFAGPNTTATFTIPTHKLAQFGQLEGSLFTHRGGTYRVMVVNYGISSTSVTCLPYNLYPTFESAWSGKTYTQFENFWDEDAYTYESFSIAPLTNEW